MQFDGKQVAEEFEEAFGFPITQLKIRQLWWLVKAIKHCRQRCRNNAALNNWLNRNFEQARFVQIQKQREDGSTYPGLRIQMDGEAYEGHKDEE